MTKQIETQQTDLQSQFAARDRVRIVVTEKYPSERNKTSNPQKIIQVTNFLSK